MVDVVANLAAASARIAAACAQAGRDPGEVELLPISKTHPAALVRDAAAAGYRRFGESRPQELARRAEELADLDLAWVAIGRVQTNKARLVAEHAAQLQSLDSLPLAEALDRRLAALGRRLPVLVQVNASGETAKAGFTAEELPAALDALAALGSLDVTGLMTMAPRSDDERVVRGCFAGLRVLRDRCRADHPGLGQLSMGMSGDYVWAVAEGSTCVRLGSTIFGDRPPSP